MTKENLDVAKVVVVETLLRKLLTRLRKWESEKKMLHPSDFDFGRKMELLDIIKIMEELLEDWE